MTTPDRRVDPIIERIANADGSVSAQALIQELIDANARIRELENGYAVRSDEVTGFIAMERDLRARIRELEARVKQLSDAADQLFSLVQENGEPLSSPANQALIGAGDTISVNEGNLWNLRWVLMAHSPSPAGSPSRPDNLSTPSALSDGVEP